MYVVTEVMQNFTFTVFTFQNFYMNNFPKNYHYNLTNLVCNAREQFSCLSNSYLQNYEGIWRQDFEIYID